MRHFFKVPTIYDYENEFIISPSFLVACQQAFIAYKHPPPPPGNPPPTLSRQTPPTPNYTAMLYNKLQKLSEGDLLSMCQEPIVNYSVNSELKKLQFYGAGPKAAIPTISTDPDGKSCMRPVQQKILAYKLSLFSNPLI